MEYIQISLGEDVESLEVDLSEEAFEELLEDERANVSVFLKTTLRL